VQSIELWDVDVGSVLADHDQASLGVSEVMCRVHLREEFRSRQTAAT
jgi:hypothetical protein